MTAQDLKNSILQLAMQGKLVEQRAEEGTAGELIAQIRSEKERLIKAGDIKKDKPLPEITDDEIPFEIPKNWEWVRLGNCISLLSGQDMTPNKYNDSETGIPYLTGASNIGNGKIIINRWTDEPKAIARKGDLLITCKGSIGVTCILTEKEVHIARQIMAITAICVEIEYIHKFLQLYVGTLKKKAKSMIPGIERKDVLNAVVPLPPLSEQKRVVAKIEELLPYIEKYDKAYSKLKVVNKKFSDDIQKSILQYAMQGKLVEQRPEEGTGEELYCQIQIEKEKLIREGKIKKEKILPKINEVEMDFKIPKTWKRTRLGNVISLLSGTDFKPEEYNDRGIGTVYITGASNLDENGVLISRWTETPRNMAYQGDVLLVCKGSGYGKTVICDIKEAHIARQIMAIRKMKTLDMKFIKYYLDANFDYLKSKGQGVIPGIDRNTVLNMVVPLPPYKEQKRIVTELEKIMPYCQMHGILEAL